MPTPASQPELHRFASPVPRYSVLPLESLGSAVSAPTEFCPIPPVRYVQLGSAATASSVRQTPPPAAPTQRRQLPGTHVGAMTRTGLRVAVVSVLPVNASTPGSIAFCSAPYACQWLLPCGSPWAAILLKVFLAFCTIRGGITLAGYVRAADLYASYPPTGPSLGIVR